MYCRSSTFHVHVHGSRVKAIGLRAVYALPLVTLRGKVEFTMETVTFLGSVPSESSAGCPNDMW